MISPAIFSIFSKFCFFGGVWRGGGGGGEDGRGGGEGGGGAGEGSAKMTHNYQFQSVTLNISRTVDHIIKLFNAQV